MDREEAKLRRREWLKAIGLGGAGLALSGSSFPSQLVAQSGPIPKRIIFVGNADGLPVDTWQARAPAGLAEPTRTDFALGPALAALEPYKSRMILFENLDMVTVHHDPTRAGNAHLNGFTHAMSAAPRFSESQPGGPSIDQVIAQALNRDAPVTRFPSVQVAITAHGLHNDMSAPQAGVTLQSLSRPTEIYDTIFGSSAAADETSSEARRFQRVLDFVSGDYAAMEARLPIRSNREKLARHRGELDAFRARLAAGLSRQDRIPDRSVVAPAENLDWSYHAPRDTVWMERWQVSRDINMKLVASMLSADLTRVVFLNLAGPPGEGIGFTERFGNNPQGDLIGNMHGLTHTVHSPVDAIASDPSVYEDGYNLILEEAQYRVEALRMLLDELASTLEPDGSTLLDHTLVVNVSHIANGSHSTDNLSWFTVGNLDGYFRTGQFIRFPRTTDPERSWISHGRPHNDLLTAIAHGMGLSIGNFGDPTVATGPITEMLV